VLRDCGNVCCVASIVRVNEEFCNLLTECLEAFFISNEVITLPKGCQDVGSSWLSLHMGAYIITVVIIGCR